MKKIMINTAKFLLYVVLAFAGVLVSIVVMVALAEGDMSHGLMWYLS